MTFFRIYNNISFKNGVVRLDYKRGSKALYESRRSALEEAIGERSRDRSYEVCLL